jgi:hypothetical protein
MKYCFKGHWQVGLLVCNMPINIESGIQDAAISAKFLLGCMLRAGVTSIFAEQYMTVVPTFLLA